MEEEMLEVNADAKTYDGHASVHTTISDDDPEK